MAQPLVSLDADADAASDALALEHLSALAEALGASPGRWSDQSVAYVAGLAGRVDPAKIPDLLDEVDRRTVDLRMGSGVRMTTHRVLQ